MPRIPFEIAQGGIPGVSGQVRGNVVPAAAQARAQVGAQIQRAGDQLQDVFTAMADGVAKIAAAAAVADAGLRLNEFELSLRADDDFATYEQRYDAFVQEVMKEKKKALPDIAIRRFEADFARTVAEKRIAIRKAAIERGVDVGKAGLLEVERKYADFAATAKDDTELAYIKSLGLKAIDDATASGFLSNEESVKRKLGFLSSVDEVRARQMILADPEAAEQALLAGRFEDVTKEKLGALVAEARAAVVRNLLDSDPHEAMARLDRGEFDSVFDARERVALKRVTEGVAADRARAAAAAERQARIEDAARFAERLMALEDAVARGEAGLREIEEAHQLDGGWLDDQNRARLHELVEETERAAALRAERIERVDRALIGEGAHGSLSGAELDPLDDQDRAAVDAHFAAFTEALAAAGVPVEQRPERVARYVAALGFVPDSLTERLTRQIESRELDLVLPAALTIAALEKQGVDVAEAFDDRTLDLARDVAESIDIGLAPERAVERALAATNRRPPISVQDKPSFDDRDATLPEGVRLAAAPVAAATPAVLWILQQLLPLIIGGAIVSQRDGDEGQEPKDQAKPEEGQTPESGDIVLAEEAGRVEESAPAPSSGPPTPQPKTPPVGPIIDVVREVGRAISSSEENKQQPKKRSPIEHIGWQELKKKLPNDPEFFVQTPEGNFLRSQDGTPNIGSAPRILEKIIENEHIPIRIRRGELRHVDDVRHNQNARALGYRNGIELLLDVSDNWNEIRHGQDQRLLLVKTNGGNRVAVVELTTSPRGDFYRVVTSGVRKYEQLGERVLRRAPIPSPTPD